MIKLIVKGNAMSGNRMKLKNGLFSIVLLTSSFLFGLESAHIEKLNELTVAVNNWADRTFNKKSNPKTYLSELQNDILQPLLTLESNIPLVPTTSEKLKKMVKDLTESLKVMHTTLTGVTNFTTLKAQLGSSSLLKELLEKANSDLDDLISHASKHPEDCSPEILAALKTYKNTTFQKCFNEWHPRTNSYFLSALNYIFRKK